MSEIKYKIGYIDEDHDDRVKFEDQIQSDEIQVVLIDPYENKEHMVEYIVDEKFDAVVVDYTLYATKPVVQYDGVELIRRLWEVRADFPAFILTNNRDENQVDDQIRSTLIFVKSQLNKENEEVARKLKKEIDFYRSENGRFSEELNDLMLKKERKEQFSDSEIQRIQELNNILEKRLNKNDKYTDIIRDSENFKTLNNILNNAEAFLKTLNPDPNA
jgi:DNA-binding NarL/FixJ family response regulator